MLSFVLHWHLLSDCPLIVTNHLRQHSITTGAPMFSNCIPSENTAAVVLTLNKAQLQIWVSIRRTTVNPWWHYDLKKQHSTLLSGSQPVTKCYLPYYVIQDSYVLLRNQAIILTVEFLNPLWPSDAYMRQYTRPSLVQIMGCRLGGAKPSSEPLLEYC